MFHQYNCDPTGSHPTSIIMNLSVRPPDLIQVPFGVEHNASNE